MIEGPEVAIGSISQKLDEKVTKLYNRILCSSEYFIDESLYGYEEAQKSISDFYSIQNQLRQGLNAAELERLLSKLDQIEEKLSAYILYHDINESKIFTDSISIRLGSILAGRR